MLKGVNSGARVLLVLFCVMPFGSGEAIAAVKFKGIIGGVNPCSSDDFREGRTNNV